MRFRTNADYAANGPAGVTYQTLRGGGLRRAATPGAARTSGS